MTIEFEWGAKKDNRSEEKFYPQSVKAEFVVRTERKARANDVINTLPLFLVEHAVDRYVSHQISKKEVSLIMEREKEVMKVLDDCELSYDQKIAATKDIYEEYVDKIAIGKEEAYIVAMGDMNHRMDPSKFVVSREIARTDDMYEVAVSYCSPCELEVSSDQEYGEIIEDEEMSERELLAFLSTCLEGAGFNISRKGGLETICVSSEIENMLEGRYEYE